MNTKQNNDTPTCYQVCCHSKGMPNTLLSFNMLSVRNNWPWSTVSVVMTRISHFGAVVKTNGSAVIYQLQTNK